MVSSSGPSEFKKDGNHYKNVSVQLVSSQVKNSMHYTDLEFNVLYFEIFWSGAKVKCILWGEFGSYIVVLQFVKAQ